MYQNKHKEEDILRLYLADYRRKLFLREISRMSGVPLRTAQRLLDGLVKHNILKSSVKGKNKYFSLNLDNNLAKEHLLRSETLALTVLLEENFLLKKIYSEIFSLAPAGAVVLFGSYAKEKQNKESDIDLLYIGEKGEQFVSEMKKTGSLYGKEINLKKTTHANFEKALRKKDALVQEVLKNHILLHQPSVFVDCVWRYYCEIR